MTFSTGGYKIFNCKAFKFNDLSNHVGLLPDILTVSVGKRNENFSTKCIQVHYMGIKALIDLNFLAGEPGTFDGDINDLIGPRGPAGEPGLPVSVYK